MGGGGGWAARRSLAHGAACNTQAVAFALDLEALAVARSTGVAVRTELLSASHSRESNSGSASLQHVAMQKLRAVQLLLHEGKTVFFLDTVHAVHICTYSAFYLSRAHPPPPPTRRTHRYHPPPLLTMV